MSTTSTVKAGDVYVCRFPFTDGRTSKARPVLILVDLGPDCLGVRIGALNAADWGRVTKAWNERFRLT